MLEFAEQQLRTARDLLKSPTPDNFAAATQTLSEIAAHLQSFLHRPPEHRNASQHDRDFLSRLPVEMARVRILLAAPVNLLEGLVSLRAQKFGSYNSEGQLQGVEYIPSSRTLTQL